MTLIAIGGAEDKSGDMVIHRRLLAEARGTATRVCVITTATSDPEDTRQRYLALYRQLGVTACDILHIQSRAMADSDDIVARIASADLVLMTGGDQLRLTQYLSGTRSLSTMVARYQADAVVIAGTSAGAAAASQLMIYGGNPGQATKKGEVMMTLGLGLVPGTAFDTHFTQRRRLSRLFNAVATNPATLGIGLDENTAVIVGRDGLLEVIGTGTVTFVDGLNIAACNIADIERGDRIALRGLSVVTLSAGSIFDMKTRSGWAR